MAHELSARMSPILYIFSGLPASGKSTLAQVVARHVEAAYVRIDTIEQALRDLCAIPVLVEGYEMAYRIAADNLRVGRHVVADSCNPVDVTRRAWERVATAAGARYVNIEVVCSDAAEHRRRAQTRVADVPRLALPDWSAIMTREYHAWTVERVVTDTAGASSTDAAAGLLAELARWRARSTFPT